MVVAYTSGLQQVLSTDYSQDQKDKRIFLLISAVNAILLSPSRLRAIRNLLLQHVFVRLRYLF